MFKPPHCHFSCFSVQPLFWDPTTSQPFLLLATPSLSFTSCQWILCHIALTILPLLPPFPWWPVLKAWVHLALPWVYLQSWLESTIEAVFPDNSHPFFTSHPMLHYTNLLISPQNTHVIVHAISVSKSAFFSSQIIWALWNPAHESPLLRWILWSSPCFQAELMHTVSPICS